MAHDVFISYSTQDKTVADAVCAKLESRKCRCWIAPRDVIPGMDWAEMIIDAISASSVVVLILSSNSNGSQNVLREVRYAVDNGAIILPFRIEAVEPVKSLQFFLGPQHWLDALTPPLDDHLTQLAETVCLLLHRPVTPPPVDDKKTPVTIDSEKARPEPIQCPACGRIQDAVSLGDVSYCSACGASLRDLCAIPLNKDDANLETRLCRSCGAEAVPQLVNGNLMCRMCGVALAVEDPMLPHEPHLDSTCPFCHSELPPAIVVGKAYCANCGTSLPEQGEANKQVNGNAQTCGACAACGSTRIVSVRSALHCADCGALLRSEDV